MYNTIKFLIPFTLGASIYLMPFPEQVGVNGWNLLAIFVATITAFITKPLPMGSIALISAIIAILSGTIQEKDIFSGFASSVSWLVLLISFITCAFIKTGLGIRIARFFKMFFGSSILGLAFSLTFTELIIAPFIPSTTTRAGGIIYPIIRSLCSSTNNISDEKSSKELEGFLILVCYHSNYITEAIFLTAMSANPMIQNFAVEQNIQIIWKIWFMAASLPGILSLIIIPLVIYYTWFRSISYTIKQKRVRTYDIQKISRNERVCHKDCVS